MDSGSTAGGEVVSVRKWAWRVAVLWYNMQRVCVVLEYVRQEGDIGRPHAKDRWREPEHAPRPEPRIGPQRRAERPRE